jgi:hypothetical protein
MADSTINYIISTGTAAEMAGFTPNPATSANAPPSQGNLFYNKTDSTLYAWTGAAWAVAVPGGSGTVTHTGTLTSGQLIKGNGGVDITVGNLTGDVTTSGAMATTIANSAVTLAKIANAAANSKLVGSGAAGSGSPYVELTLGTNLSMSGTTLNATGGSGAAGTYIQLQDQKAQNTSGGTFTSGSWVTRTLNTEVTDAGGNCTLASNQFTLTAGDYYIRASAPAYQVVRHQLRLQNVTGGTTLITGLSSVSGTSVVCEMVALLSGQFTVAASQALELQHRCESTFATQGLGIESNVTTEIYANVELWKIS